jgi:predicted O-linked N-acetylglucosamine transferase (SPINDLY family)
VLGSAARWADAEPCYRKALALAQEDPTLHFRLGQTLFALGRLDDAEQSLRRSLTCQPDQVDPLCQLAEICLAGGRIDEALACYERILALPDLDARTVDNVGSSRLFALAHQPGLPPDQLFTEHLRYGAQLAQVVSNPCTTWSNRPDPHRVITIGMVSGDLYNHAVALFLAPILARLVADGRHRIEIYQTQSASDDVTARLRGYCHGWTMVQSMSDAELVAKIRADGVDILIDLAGHTGGHRLRAFAARPAPIQVSWLGYAGTTGLAAVDYYIGDEAYLPAGFESQFSEQLVRLPGTVPMPEVLDLPALSPLPALASGHFTFGSFNRGGKINGATLNLWAALLRAVLDSRMLIGHIGGSSLAPKIHQALVDQGVAAARVEFVGRLGYTEYLRCHARVDLCLDTFPYTGGTTTTSALLMGVPTLTIGGPTPISRQSTLRMAGAGLQAFVAEDAEDFVAQGVYWAQRPSELAALRAGMRERIAASPALQPDVIAASLSRALRTMWQRWCAGLPPAPIRT